jgi:hypothetical protein
MVILIIKNKNTIMKKLFILSFAAITVFAACNQSATTTDASQQSVPTAAEDSLAGTFTSKDAKSAKLLSTIKLFSKEDTSYLVNYAPNFTLKLMSDTAVIARGPEGFAAYHKNLHNLFTDINFADGNTFTYVINNGEVWSAYFGQCTATGKNTNTKYVMPVNVWVRWDGDKIVFQSDVVDSRFANAEMAAAKK